MQGRIIDIVKPSPMTPSAPSGPLRVAVTVKQVPVTEALSLSADGRLRREGADAEMNPFCRRAVAKGVELAKASGGTCVVFTLGPLGAEDVLREAVAWGADLGVHLCDPELAGSDTLATVHALDAAMRHYSPFDLIITGRNSIDGETGQVGPELAEVTGLPFASGVRHLELNGSVLHAELEHDDGYEEVELSLPAVISVAERLCDPCKVPPEKRAAVPAATIRRLSASDLGIGPWGEKGSATRVERVRSVAPDRAGIVLSGGLVTQVTDALEILTARGALDGRDGKRMGGGVPTKSGALITHHGTSPARSSSNREPGGSVGQSTRGGARVDRREHALIGVVLEPERPKVDAELLGMAARLAAGVGGVVVALSLQPSGVDPRGAGGPVPGGAAGSLEDLGALGADQVLAFRGEAIADDVASEVGRWVAEERPRLVIAPGTAFGREVAGRVAAATESGLVGDAIDADMVDGHLVAVKPALSGAQVADVVCTTGVEMVTFRPGVLVVPPRRQSVATVSFREIRSRGRVRVLSSRRDDDVEVLARASAVIGVGIGVQPDEYSSLSTLAALLGADLAATRKVTDRGWAPRSRQVGITGRSIGPDLYVAIGLSGKLNHMVGTRSAGTVLFVNCDPAAPGFAFSDVGIVGDWHDVVPLLEDGLRKLSAGRSAHGVDDDLNV